MGEAEGTGTRSRARLPPRGALPGTCGTKGAGSPGRLKVNSEAQTSKGRDRLNQDWKRPLCTAVKTERKVERDLVVRTTERP